LDIENGAKSWKRHATHKKGRGIIPPYISNKRTKKRVTEGGGQEGRGDGNNRSNRCLGSMGGYYIGAEMRHRLKEGYQAARLQIRPNKKNHPERNFYMNLLRD